MFAMVNESFSSFWTPLKTPGKTISFKLGNALWYSTLMNKLGMQMLQRRWNARKFPDDCHFESNMWKMFLSPSLWIEHQSGMKVGCRMSQIPVNIMAWIWNWYRKLLCSCFKIKISIVNYTWVQQKSKHYTAYRAVQVDEPYATYSNGVCTYKWNLPVFYSFFGLNLQSIWVSLNEAW